MVDDYLQRPETLWQSQKHPATQSILLQSSQFFPFVLSIFILFDREVKSTYETPRLYYLIQVLLSDLTFQVICKP